MGRNNIVQLVELTGNDGERLFVNPNHIFAIIENTDYRRIISDGDVDINVKESMDDILTALKFNNLIGGVWYARDGGQEHRD